MLPHALGNREEGMAAKKRKSRKREMFCAFSRPFREGASHRSFGARGSRMPKKPGKDFLAGARPPR
jgi:hypothetical protein